MFYAIYRSGPNSPPIIKQFETVEQAKAFVASRVGEVWIVIDETGKEVE